MYTLPAIPDIARVGAYGTTFENETIGLEAVNGRTAAKSRRVTEAAKLMSRVFLGKEDPYLLKQLQRPTSPYALQELREKYPGLFPTNAYMETGLKLVETMSTTDFTALTVDVLDRIYYGYYNTQPIPNKPLVKNHPLRDFRNVKRFSDEGVVTPLTVVATGQQPPERSLTENTPILYAPDLYAARTAVNWRAIVNDDLGMFQDLPKRLAIAGNRGIHKAITKLYVDANGPNASLYTSAFTNQIIVANGASIANPSLSIQGIQDAFKVLARMRDSGGDPIIFGGTLYLWYGPALVATAMNLQNTLSSQISVEGGTQAGTTGFPAQFLEVSNWAMRNMVHIMDPYIPIVCTTATTQDTMWGLTYDPEVQQRPSLEFGFLTGFETPQLYSKVPNTMRMGGGVEPTLGDFYTMDQELKVITVFGGTQIDGRSTVASTGRNA